MPTKSSDSSTPDVPDRTNMQADAPPTAEFSADSTSPSFGTAALAGGVPAYPFLSPPQLSDEIGRLGDYRILKKLGEGGMGFVFRGHDPALNRNVALKVMRPEVASKPQAADRFLREGRAAAGLKSDHIITIYQVGQANGVPFLAMEFLEGLPLDEWIRGQKKAVPLPHALRVVRDTLRGLAAAHDKGLIHRDIKPANLWIEKGTARIKVLDFGLTRSNEADMQLTQEGAVVGTPAFMAPEQASGKPVDPRADLFSVGVILYTLLGGKNPFSRGNLMETLGAVGFETQPPVTTVRPDVPQEYSDFIDRLLAKKPDGRPANAKAALLELVGIEKKLQDATKTVASSGSVPVVAMPAPAAVPQVWNELTEEEDVKVRTGRAEKPRSATTVEKAADTPKQPPASKKKLLIGGGLFAFLLVLGGIIIVITNKDGTKTKVEVPDGATVDVQQGGKSVATVGPKKADPTKLGPPDADGWQAVAADEIDLLALDEKAVVTPPTLVAWNKRNGHWVSTPREKSFSAVVLPFKANGAYSLTLDVTLDAGNDFLGINLPVGPKGGVCFEFNGVKGTVWEFLDIKGFEDHNPKNPTYTVKQPVAIGKQMKLMLTVKPQGDQVTLVAAVEGHDEIRWKGPASDLSLPTYQNFPAGQLSLVSFDCQWTVSSLKYKKIDGTAYTRAAPAADGWQAIAADEIDLLAFDENFATTPPDLGAWTRRDGKWISTPQQKFTGVTLPFKPEGGYTLTTEATCEEVSDYLGMILPIGGKRGVVFTFNGVNGTLAGFQEIKGISTTDVNSPARLVTTPVALGKRIKMTFTVKPEGDQVGLVAAVEGYDEIRWKGSAADLSVATLYHAPSDQVSLLSFGSRWTVHALKYKKLDGTAYTRTASAADADRKAAELAIARGGHVELVGESVAISDAAKLPANPFKIRFVRAEREVTDADLDVFRELTDVRNMNLHGTITDAGVKKLATGPCAAGLQILVISSPSITDAAFVSAAKFPKLQTLVFQNSPKISGQGLGLLRGPTISALGISLSGVVDPELAPLKDMPNLRNLDLSRTPITDTGLAHIGQISRLEILNISQCTKVTDAGMKSLEKLEQLDQLELHDNSLTPAGWASVAAIPKLRLLYAHNAPTFTDEGATALAKSPSLNLIVVPSTSLTDAGLKALAGCKTLKSLNVTATKVTADGVTAFRKTRPDVKVTSDFDVDTDRKAAEFVIGKGGSVDLGDRGGFSELTKLPAEPFKITGIWIYNPKAGVTDADLDLFHGLASLERIGLRGPITDAGVKKLADHPRAAELTEIRIDSTVLTDAAFAAVPQFRHLQTLMLGQEGGGGKITGQGFAHLNGLSLEKLYVTGHSVVDAELPRLQSLPKLTALHLTQSPVTDAGLAHLGKLTQLTELGLYGVTTFTDAGVKHLAGLTKLQALRANACPFGDTAFTVLAALPDLQSVDLDNQTKITDANMKVLAKSPRLVRLNVGATALTDEGLQALAGCKRLKAVSATQTKLTAEGVTKFRKARPDVTIESDFAEKK